MFITFGEDYRVYSHRITFSQYTPKPDQWPMPPEFAVRTLEPERPTIHRMIPGEPQQFVVSGEISSHHLEHMREKDFWRLLNDQYVSCLKHATRFLRDDICFFQVECRLAAYRSISPYQPMWERVVHPNEYMTTLKEGETQHATNSPRT